MKVHTQEMWPRPAGAGGSEGVRARSGLLVCIYIPHTRSASFHRTSHNNGSVRPGETAHASSCPPSACSAAQDTSS
eukprot:scaffold71807_cov21-Tisochrysis_lutea.AAC.1